MIAKMDELTPRKVIASGRYRLVPVIANMDELIVEIGVISGGVGTTGRPLIAKR